MNIDEIIDHAAEALATDLIKKIECGQVSFEDAIKSLHADGGQVP